MPYYLLKRDDSEVGYDEVDGLVVKAQNDLDARMFAMAHAADEGRDIWLDEARVTCTVLEDTADNGVVLRSFNAG